MSWQRDRSASAGLLPVKGTFGDVRKGSLIRGDDGRLEDVWEVIDLRSPAQFDHLMTPWFLAVNRTTGEQKAVPPRPMTYACTFMVPEETVDPEEDKPKLDPDSVAEHEPLSDQAEVDLLRSELGATLLAAHDRETGVILCPPFEATGFNRAAYHAHIEFAHGLDLSGIDPNDVETIVSLHGKAHADGSKRARAPGLGGFPHAHPWFATKHPFLKTDY